MLAALCVCLLLSASAAIAQAASDAFEAHVAEAVKAQSAGNLTTAIAEYKSALAIRPKAAEIWANLGLMQHQAGDREGATASFTQAHLLQPKLFVPVFFLGLENLQAGKKDEAVHYLTAAQKIQQDDPNVPMYLGQAYFDLKRFDEAATSYAAAVKLNPANGEAWYRLGISHLESAEADSGRLARANRKSPFFKALAADSLGSQGKVERAAAAYREVLAAPVRPPCMRSSLGFVLLRQGQFAEAAAEFQQDLNEGGCLQAQLGMLRLAFEKDQAGVSLSPLSALWTTDRGFVESHGSLLSTGLTPEQFTALDKGLASASFSGLPPSDAAKLRASLHGAHGEMTDQIILKPATSASASDDFRSGRYQLCVSRLRPPLATLPRNKVSMLAACSFFTGDYATTLDAARNLRRSRELEDEGLYWSIRANQELAVECLLRAGETASDSIRLHELLAETYRDMNQYGAAEAEYTTALHMNPNDFIALLGAAANYLQEYRIDLAAEMIERALKRSPADPEANYIMGEVLIDQHHLDQAEPFLKAGLAAKPELVPRIHALLGQVYASRGEDDRAIEELRLGTASDDDGSVHFQLGRLYQKTGQPKLATAEFAATRQIQNKQQGK